MNTSPKQVIHPSLTQCMYFKKQEKQGLVNIQISYISYMETLLASRLALVIGKRISPTNNKEVQPLSYKRKNSRKNQASPRQNIHPYYFFKEGINIYERIL